MEQIERTSGLAGTALVALLVLGLVAVLANTMPSAGWSIVSLIVFGWYVVRMAQTSPFGFALMLDFVFFRLTTLISGVAISAGGLMSEINLVGVPSAAFPLLAMVYVVFTAVVAGVIERPSATMAKRWGPELPNLTHAWWVWPFFGVVALVGLYVLVVGAMSGFPLLTGMDRFIWRGQFEGNRIFGFWFANRALISVILGVIWVRSDGMTKMLAQLGLLGVLGVSFLMGEKFTSIVLILIGFALPWLVHAALGQPWKNLKRFLPLVGLGGVIVLLTIPALLVAYGWMSDADNATATLLQRVAGQAQLWEAVYQDKPPLLNDEPDVRALEWYLIQKGHGVEASEPPFAGLYHLMALYMLPKTYTAYLAKGITLTMGFEAYLLKMYGWLGMLLPLVAIAAFYALHVRYLAFALLTCDPIRLALILKLMVAVNFGLQQGYVWFIVSSKNAVLIALIVAYELWMRNQERQRA